MKYYSEILKKLFNTAEEVTKAESSYRKQCEDAKELKTKSAQNVLDSYSDLIKLEKAYEKFIKDFNAEYDKADAALKDAINKFISM